MAKFKLIADPTFRCEVSIPRPGLDDGQISFDFKHYSVDKLTVFETELKDKPIIEFMIKIVSGWNLDEEFNQENLNILLNNYPAAWQAITNSYYKEMLGQREKNS